MSLSKEVLIDVFEACLGGSLPLFVPVRGIPCSTKAPFLAANHFLPPERQQQRCKEPNSVHNTDCSQHHLYGDLGGSGARGYPCEAPLADAKEDGGMTKACRANPIILDGFS